MGSSGHSYLGTASHSHCTSFSSNPNPSHSFSIVALVVMHSILRIDHNRNRSRGRPLRIKPHPSKRKHRIGREGVLSVNAEARLSVRNSCDVIVLGLAGRESGVVLKDQCGLDIGAMQLYPITEANVEVRCTLASFGIAV